MLKVMANPPLEFLTEIAALLSTGPLYSSRQTKSLVDYENLGTDRNNFIPLPSIIRKYCDGSECNTVTNWMTPNPRISVADYDYGSYYETLDSVIVYRCRNCGTLVCYMIAFSQSTDQSAILMKTGEFPEPSITPPRDLKLPSNDLVLYRRAPACRQHNFGIGAIAYLRRIVENSLNLLCDMVIDVCRTVDSTIDAEALKKQRYQDKTEFAKSHLPARLTRDGHNPLSILVTFTSDALHGSSDDECTRKFDDVREVFELTYRSLEFEIKEAAEYGKVLGKFTSKQRDQRGE
jgi:hypothetical protein